MSYIQTSQGIRIQQEPASFAARLAAFAIDAILIGIAYTILGFLIRSSYFLLFDYLNRTFAFVLCFMLPYLYPLMYETFGNGQTIGKKILHIRVVTIDGGGPKMTSLILRWLFLPIDAFMSFGIGPLCIFFTQRQQRLGDLVAGTWVVRTQEYEKADFA